MMKKSTLKLLFIIILFVLATSISWKNYLSEYVQEDKLDLHQFPKVIGSWSSEELTITDKEYEILETRNAFARKYIEEESGDVAYLFIVYSENNRKVSHPPEICYIGGGVSVTDSEHKFIKNPLSSEHPIKVNELILERGKFQQLAYYWFKVGSSFTSNYWKQQFLIAAKSLFGKPASSALIRVSTNVKNGDVSSSEKQVEKFCDAMLPQLIEFLL